jgi:hypothetical protein
MLWHALVVLGTQALVEEPTEQQAGTDCQERERPLHRAEAREVEQEELPKADREQDEAAAA